MLQTDLIDLDFGMPTNEWNGARNMLKQIDTMIIRYYFTLTFISLYFITVISIFSKRTVLEIEF